METAAQRQKRIHGWGADASLDRRPGVPMEAEPRIAPHAHWIHPERQRARVEILKHSELDELTPVFGTAQPPRGLSGIMRRAAYRIPTHKPSHWMTLLAADRVDVIESSISDLGGRRSWVLLGALVAGVAMWRALNAATPGVFPMPLASGTEG